MSEESKPHKQTKVGEVVSTKMQKTIVVQVERRVPHPLYRRIVSQRKKFHAHDETEQFRLNDLVEIQECRPRSATKRWEAIRLIERPEEV